MVNHSNYSDLSADYSYQSKDSSYTYIHIRQPHLINLFEVFPPTLPILPPRLPTPRLSPSVFLKSYSSHSSSHPYTLLGIQPRFASRAWRNICPARTPATQSRGRRWCRAGSACRLWYHTGYAGEERASMEGSRSWEADNQRSRGAGRAK